MTSEVVAQGHVVRAIDTFATTITHYLLPVIRFVGRQDERCAALAKLYPTLVHEKRYSGGAADLVVFDHFPTTLLREPDSLGADAAYLFCLDREEELPGGVPPASLARLNALSLVDPDTEEFLWHVTALLTLRDLSYSNGHSVFPELLSADQERRRTLSEIVAAVLASRSCILTVANERHRDTVSDFLFDTMAEPIAPVRIASTAIDPHLLATDRYNIIDGSALSDAKLGALVERTADDELSARPSLMIFRIADSPPNGSFPESWLVRSLDLSVSEASDLPLLAYTLSMWRSHLTADMGFYSAEAARVLLDRAQGDPAKVRELLAEVGTDENAPSEEFRAWLALYRRLSLDSILDETERTIMTMLRELSPTVGAASHAGGMPAITWRKRSARLADKSSLVKLLASARSI